MSFAPTPLNLPTYPFKIKEEAGSIFIFDEIRKKYLLLTPEEWVRQHVVQFLIHEKKYPKSLIKLEGGLKLNSLQKRTDILIFNPSGNKVVLVECKSPSIKITQHVFDQIARYNFVHRTPWLIVSNGMQHYCCQIDFQKETYQFEQEIPDFNIFR
ncbi:MAG TPA: type I restriction enzyme HsdR N-terminal domain-containing protein [Sphingobacteriaceae bacterium]|nr:type I restriction enzyme HsdR N-terminal domain-containing protein [Sphingobacteriaceae bacterium]